MEQSISPIRSLRGHTGDIQEVIFSNYKNNHRIVSTSDDKTVRIWDVETGNQVGESLKAHASETIGVAVSRDGRKIVNGAGDGKVTIWDAETREIIKILPHHTLRTDCVQFSPDEERIASASYDTTLKIWNAETGELLFDIDDHQNSVRSLAYSPSGARIATGSHDCTVRIRNAATGKQQAQPLVHGDEVHSVVWSKDSRLLISACKDGQIYFWSAPTGAQLGSPLHAHSKSINLLAISPNGELIASASRDSTVRLWNVTTRRPFGRVLQHSREVYTVAFSLDGQLVATGGQEKTIFLWDISHETIIVTNAVPPPSVVPASNLLTDLQVDQASESATSVSHITSPTPALAGFGQPDGIEFHPGSVRLRHSATSASLPSQGHSNPGILAASSSTPVLATPSKSSWKRFFMLDRSSASVGTSKRWKIPRIDNILRRKRRNMDSQVGLDES